MAKFAQFSSNLCYLSFCLSLWKNLYFCPCNVNLTYRKMYRCVQLLSKIHFLPALSRENLCSEELRYWYWLCLSVPCPTGHWDQRSLSCLPCADNTFREALLAALPTHGHVQPLLSFGFAGSIPAPTGQGSLPPGQPVPPPASLHFLRECDLLSQEGPCSSALTSCQALLDVLCIRLASSWAQSLEDPGGTHSPFVLQDSPSRSSAN